MYAYNISYPYGIIKECQDSSMQDNRTKVIKQQALQTQSIQNKTKTLFLQIFKYKKEMMYFWSSFFVTLMDRNPLSPSCNTKCSTKNISRNHCIQLRILWIQGERWNELAIWFSVIVLSQISQMACERS